MTTGTGFAQKVPAPLDGADQHEAKSPSVSGNVRNLWIAIVGCEERRDRANAVPACSTQGIEQSGGAGLKPAPSMLFRIHSGTEEQLHLVLLQCVCPDCSASSMLPFGLQHVGWSESVVSMNP